MLLVQIMTFWSVEPSVISQRRRHRAHGGRRSQRPVQLSDRRLPQADCWVGNLRLTPPAGLQISGQDRLVAIPKSAAKTG
jgi:hypothetical protein